MKATMPSPFIITMLITRQSENLTSNQRGERHITEQVANIRMIADLSSEPMQVRRQGSNIFKVSKYTHIHTHRVNV